MEDIKFTVFIVVINS